MKCIIIDDEATARTILVQLCEQLPNLQVKNTFSDALHAIKYLNQHAIDLIFLDLHIPVFSGFDFIATLSHPPKIILTTSDPSFALEAFEHHNIVGYLLKPIDFESFEKAIKNFAAKTTIAIPEENPIKEIKDLFVTVDKKLVKVHIPEIYLIEAKGDYIQIQTKDHQLLVHATMKKIEQKLPSTNFIKVHRSFIINIKHIVDIEENSVMIKKKIIPVSRKNRALLLRCLNRL